MFELTRETISTKTYKNSTKEIRRSWLLCWRASAKRFFYIDQQGLSRERYFCSRRTSFGLSLHHIALLINSSWLVQKWFFLFHNSKHGYLIAQVVLNNFECGKDLTQTKSHYHILNFLKLRWRKIVNTFSVLGFWFPEDYVEVID